MKGTRYIVTIKHAGWSSEQKCTGKTEAAEYIKQLVRGLAPGETVTVEIRRNK